MQASGLYDHELLYFTDGFDVVILDGPDADDHNPPFVDVFKTSIRFERDRRGDPAPSGRSMPHWQQKL